MRHLLTLMLLDERLRTWRTRTAWFLFVMILIAGSIPGARADIGHVASGLVLHSLAYGGITLLLFTGASGSRIERALRAVVTVAAMGATDELLQSMLPYRVGALLDWLVDVSASLVTAGLLARFLPAPIQRSTC